MAQKSVFEAAGFRHDFKSFEEPDKGGHSGICTFVIVFMVLIGIILALFFLLKSNEMYSSYYDAVKKNGTYTVQIRKGARIHYAPFDWDNRNADCGIMPELIEVTNISLYEARFIPNNSNNGQFIGMPIELFRGYSNEYMDLSPDRDGIVWFHASMVNIISPEVP
jgi:hypothetical protein